MTVRWFSPTLTRFQRDTIAALAARADFARFHTCDDGFALEGRTRPGPLMVLWSDTAGRLHGWRVGVRRVLRTVTARGEGT